MTAYEQKKKFLFDETALSQAEAALIIGCRARDLHEYIKPTFFVNGRPKFRQADVLKVRSKMITAHEKQITRNREILQERI